MEFVCVGDSWKLIYQKDLEEVVRPSPDEHMVVNVYHGKHKIKKENKPVVVDRNDNILKADEIKKHWPEVCAAMQKELETWSKLLKMWSKRVLQMSIRNIIFIDVSSKKQYSKSKNRCF